jgi:hypothetical protein
MQFGKRSDGFENSRKVTRGDEYLFSKNVSTYFFSS